MFYALGEYNLMPINLAKIRILRQELNELLLRMKIINDHLGSGISKTKIVRYNLISLSSGRETK